MLQRRWELGGAGAKVTSKQEVCDWVWGMYRDSLGSRWEMWIGKTKHGTSKEFIKRFRRDFQWPTFMQVAKKLNGTTQKRILDQCTFLIVSRSVLLRMRNVSDKSCRENQNTHFVYSNIFFFFRKSCRLWNKVLIYSRAGQFADDNIIWGMRFACRINKARIQAHNQNMQKRLFSHCNNCYANAAQCYFICTLSVSLYRVCRGGMYQTSAECSLR